MNFISSLIADKSLRSIQNTHIYILLIPKIFCISRSYLFDLYIATPKFVMSRHKEILPVSVNFLRGYMSDIIHKSALLANDFHQLFICFVALLDTAESFLQATAESLAHATTSIDLGVTVVPASGGNGATSTRPRL